MAAHGSPSSQPPVPVPQWNLDPVSSLQPWPVEFTFAGHDYVIPALPALDWLTVLMDKVDPWLIVPGLVENPMGLGFDIIESGDQYNRLILDVIEVASARRWWIALRLISTAHHFWPTLGVRTARMVDANQVSLPLWLDVLTENMFERMSHNDSSDATMFVLKTEMPPPGFELEEPEMTAEQFLSIADE